mgnify:CR=1 FL=1
MASDVRVRFAPSPTGKLHIGGARTAIYNWAFARANGGTFILRIDDTDPTRSTDENTQIILRAMRWLGLDWDEGPEVGGDFGPYAQTERLDLYKQAAQKLWDEGKAYPCFCTKEQLDADRKAAQERKDPFQGYQRRCRNLDPEEARRRIEAGESYVLRIKVPEDRGDVVIHDAVHGEVTFDAKELDDFVIFRSDGTPTYNFATVVDDAMMKITHVIRGDDHLSNTPRQVMVYEALGAPVPTFAHISMILGADGKKLSKRHGATSVEEYRDAGYLSDAFVNYLALLGWSPRGERAEQEFFTMSELAEAFDIAGISKSPAIFDIEKLTYFNANYIRNMAPEDFAKAAEPFIRQSVKNEAYSASEIAALLQARCEKLTDIPEKVDFFDALPDYDLAFYTNKKSKTDAAVSLEMLQKVLPKLEALNDWSTDGIHDMLIAFAEELGVKNATLMWPLRIACAGKLVTPGGAVEICKILGKDETISRVKRGIEKLGG